MSLKKYIRVAKNTWQEILTYRLNFVIWRLRLFLQTVSMYFLWFAVLPKDQIIFGYSQTMMLTYIFGTSFIGSIVFSSRTIDVGDEINQGNLSNFLIRPINYFYYWFSKDVGDKLMNIFFSIGELFILFLILRPPLFLQTDLYFLFFSIVSIFFALILFYFFNFLIGLIGFWSQEVWAPRFVFFLLLTFFAGSLFPLDILPKNIFNILQFLPFNYLLFFPLKIYLGQISQSQIYFGIFMSFIWTILMSQITLFVWKRGLRVYTAYGR